MPANLPPQYHEAEERYRQAKTPQGKVAALQEMMAIMPKHKGTDHLRAQLRARLSRHMAELEGPSRGAAGRVEPFSMPKEGAGRAALVGLPNVGKSLLLARATGAQARVAGYPFTTQEPMPGILRFENVPIQLVDTPPISHSRIQGRLYGLLRNSDVFVVVIDLSLDTVAQAQEVFDELEQWGFRLLEKAQGQASEESPLRKPTLLAGNKGDLAGALDQFQRLEEAYGDSFPVLLLSAAEGVGLEELAREVFEALGVIRVYTKAPKEQLSRSDPLLLPLHSTVADAAELVHKDWKQRLKYALVWGVSGKFEAQRVGRGHVLADEDVIELHG